MWILPLLLLCLVMSCHNELFRVCDCSPSCVWVQMQQSWKSWKASTWTYTPLSLYLHQLMPEVKQLQCNSIAKTFCKLERLLPPSLSCHCPPFLQPPLLSPASLWQFDAHAKWSCLSATPLHRPDIRSSFKPSSGEDVHLSAMKHWYYAVAGAKVLISRNGCRRI